MLVGGAGRGVSVGITAGGGAGSGYAADAAATGGGGGNGGAAATDGGGGGGGSQAAHHAQSPTGFIGLISGYGVVDQGVAVEPRKQPTPASSKLISVMHGVGELDVTGDVAAEESPPTSPFLILVRGLQ